MALELNNNLLNPSHSQVEASVSCAEGVNAFVSSLGQVNLDMQDDFQNKVSPSRR